MDKTTIIGGKGNQGEISKRVEELKKSLEETE
jgi:hypothetical protein